MEVSFATIALLIDFDLFDIGNISGFVLIISMFSSNSFRNFRASFSENLC